MTEQEAIKFLTGYLDSVVYKEKCVEAHKLAKSRHLKRCSTGIHR